MQLEKNEFQGECFVAKSSESFMSVEIKHLELLIFYGLSEDSSNEKPSTKSSLPTWYASGKKTKKFSKKIP